MHDFISVKIEQGTILKIVDQYDKALLDMGILNWNCNTNGEINFLTNYLTPLTAPVVFDVGANIGNYSESVKKICTSAQVYAFEPHPVTFMKLQQCATQHYFKAINCGLGKDNENTILYDYKNDDGSEHASLFKDVIEQIHGGESKAHDIEIKKLDEVIFELQIDKINLLKIDTEGNEFSVLAGGEKSIRSGMIDIIHFEFNEMNVVSRTFFKDFYDFLPEYDFFRIVPNGLFHIDKYIPRLCEIFAYQNIICVKKQNTPQNRSQLDLDRIIPPEIKNDEFYHLISQISQEEDIHTALEIGSSAGGGSTEAFVKGLEGNHKKPSLHCMEVSLPRYEALKKRYTSYPFVHCYNVSSVPRTAFPTEKEVSLFYKHVPTNLNSYPLEQVLGWLNQDINYITSSDVPENGIQLIKRQHNIGTFDIVLIDGSEFTGKAEFDEIYGARWILLDDVNCFKNYENYHCLKKDPAYEIYRENWQLRNGYAIFKKREEILPIHFFTIVLNGMPFIKHHIDVLQHLPFRWHWHIVEGVADLVNDTAWSKQLGGHIPDECHRNGLSIDGTTNYLDQLKRQFPDQISIYRKPEGCIWEGKLEMVNAPISSIREECLLWQIDVDEYWTTEQITSVRNLFAQHPAKTAAFYWCHFFVGKDLVVNSRNCYSQNPAQEWLRTWRYTPGCQWVAHEPPRLHRPLPNGSSVDLAGINPFLHDETERQGLIFQHFAYVLPEQLHFKESYYGYKGALSNWMRLQDQKNFPVYLRDYFPWVGDNTTVIAAAHHGVIPLKISANGQNSEPKIIVDGVFFQLMNTGIARLWSTLLTEWAKTGFAASIVLLDRAGTAPKIAGIQTRVIPAYDYNATAKDRAMLQSICDEERADLFVSTYYSAPITTPSVFYAYDMIPEVLNKPFFNLNDPMWREKHSGIAHASAFIAISRNTALDLVRFHPSAESAITVAYPAVDTAQFYPSPEHEIALFTGKYAIKKPYFLFVGSRQNYKNGALFFEGFSHIADRTSYEIVCVGGSDTLEPPFAQLALDVQVHLLRLPDDELRTAYSGALALVYPSIYEGFGLPILEAMACDCPVITCHNSSIPEAAGAAALYVGHNKPDEMTEALQHILTPEIRTQLIKMGHRQLQKFSWNKMANEVRDSLITVFRSMQDKQTA